MNILDKILETKRSEISACNAAEPFADIERRAFAVVRPALSFSGSIRDTKCGIVAEFKRRSPSKGWINREAPIETTVGGYSQGGAAAISVLTDRDYFGGSLDDLTTARGYSAVPLLRKDFIVDRYQVCQARLAGADAVLLIAAALDAGRVRALASYARSLGLEVLLEIHNEAEAACICEEVDVVGVNNRDLASFVTDTSVSERLAGVIPSSFVRISESGISSPGTVCRLMECGYDGFLMGENFMKEADPAAALANFITEVCDGRR